MGVCPGCESTVHPVNKGGIGGGVDEYVCPNCDYVLGVAKR